MLIPLLKLLEKPAQSAAILIIILRALTNVFWLELNVSSSHRPFFDAFENSGGIEIVNKL